MQHINLPNGEIYEVCEDQTAEEVIKEICINYYQIDIELNTLYIEVLALWILCITESSKIDETTEKVKIGETNKKQGCQQTNKLQLQLKEDHRLIDVKNKMKILLKNEKLKIKFKLARNGYYPIEEEEKIKDLKLLRFLYFEAKDNVHQNIYPLTCSQRVKLSEIEFLIEKQNSNRELSFFDLIKQESKKLTYQNSLRRKQNQFQMVVHAICKTNSFRSDNEEKSELELYMEYLKKCHQMVPCYGGFFFEGQMERSIIESILHYRLYDKKVIIGINEKGLHIINHECPKIIFSISFSDLYYGILRPRKENHHYCLYIKTANIELKQIFTRQASFIDKTLERFIENKKPIGQV